MFVGGWELFNELLFYSNDDLVLSVEKIGENFVK